jgi:autotransporter-associated beta strand protein
MRMRKDFPLPLPVQLRHSAGVWISRYGLGLLSVFATCNALAINLRWDAIPAAAGLQDGSGNFSNLGALTNWWDGTRNVAWVSGATAVIGSNLTANATITLTNPILAGGIILSNNVSFTNGTAVPVYTFNGSAGSTGTNLSLTGKPAVLLHAANYTDTPVGASGNETFNVSLIATGGLRVLAATPWVAQASFNNTTNYIVGSLEIGTAGNASYASPSAILAQFNSSGTGAGALTGCTNVIIHTNASLLLRGGSGAFTMNWPKKFILRGDGIPNSSFCFGALLFFANNGTVFPADIELAGDSTVVGAWGDASVTLTNSGTISGTGRLRFCNSANRGGSSTVVITGVHTYLGDTILDGRITVRLASGAADRLPAGTSLKLGTSGAFYASNSAGIPQSGWNGYGRLVLGDTSGAANQTLTGLTNDPSLTGSAGCWLVGGNASAISILTINCASNWTYNARLGGPASPDSSIGLVKTGSGTLNLQGVNQCAGGYTISQGTLVFGDGITDNALSGPITNNANLLINAASSLTFGDGIAGAGLFTKGGAGTLTLTGTNSYTGCTLVQAGKLTVSTGISGGGPILVSPGAALEINRTAPASSLTAANLLFDGASAGFNYNLQSGNGAAPLEVAGTLTNRGSTTISILNLGSLAAGAYPLIHYGNYESNDFSAFALAPLAPGINASVRNNPGTRSIELVVSPPPGLTAGVEADGLLRVSWPAGCTGWQLQEQTNSLNVGLSTNWFAVSGSTATNVLSLSIDTAVPTAFFRLVYPPVTNPPAPADSAVRAIDWSVFQAGAPSDTNARLVTAILQNASEYAMTTWWNTYYAAQDAAYYLSYGGTDETHIRRPGMEAYGLAVSLQTGAYDAVLAGVSASSALNRTLKMTRSLGYCHLVNQAGGWGNDWQTAHWAWLAGTAGWMLWTNLPPTDQELVRRMVEYEANRFTNYAVPYYMNRAGTIISPGDTKSEENAWNAELLHLAVCMMPVHSNAPLWWSKAIEMTLSTYARPSDVNRTNMYHGRTLAAWLNGSNANEDSTVINHNIVHPDYLAAGLSQMQPALLYLLAARTVPAASFFNLDVSYRAMVDLNFVAGTTPYPVGGPLWAPGGFIYMRDASNQPSGSLYYPQGNDWGTMRRMHVATMDAVVRAFNLDGLASIPGDRWEAQHDQVVLGMQARFTDGHTYGAASEDTYALREEWLCYFAAKSLQTKWLVYQGPLRISNQPFGNN